LKTLAAHSVVMRKAASHLGQCWRRFPAMPRPVTRARRAPISWIATSSGKLKSSVQASADLRVRADAAGIVVAGAGDESRTQTQRGAALVSHPPG